MNCPNCGYSNRLGASYCAGCGARVSGRLGQVLGAGATLDSGRYVVQRLLGQGGNGAVYLADDRRLGRVCVVKELLGYFASTAERQRAEQDFRREALMLARLSTEHVALPQTYDYFSDDNRYYLVMQYIAGRNLEERLKEQRGPLPPNEVIELASAIAEVLMFLHAQQPEAVIHRDVKPANVIVDPVGRVKLVDFGLAKSLSHPPGTMTPTQMRMHTTAAGTAGYSPLEQWMLLPEPRSDVYALGATMHHLLSGRDPRNEFPSRELNIELIRSHSTFPSLRSLRPELAPELDTLVGHMLAATPAERPAADEVKESLALLRRRSAARRSGRWTAPPAPAPDPAFSFPLVPRDDLLKEVQAWFTTTVIGVSPQDEVEMAGAEVLLLPFALFEYRVDARFENSSGALIGTLDEGGTLLLEGEHGTPVEPQLARFMLARRGQLTPFTLPPPGAAPETNTALLKLSEAKLSEGAATHLITHYTRRISYTAGNGRNYERLCRPLMRQVALADFTRLYVPLWKVRMRLRGREYRFEAYQGAAAPGDPQVLFVKDSTLPGTALCATCGSLNRREVMVRCQHCGKQACPRCVVLRSKLGIFRKQFCSETCAEQFLTSRSVLSWL